LNAIYNIYKLITLKPTIGISLVII